MVRQVQRNVTAATGITLTHDEMRAWLVRKICGAGRVVCLDNLAMELPRSTSDMTKAEMIAFVEDCREWNDDRMGFPPVMLPAEYTEWAQEGL